MSAVPGWCTSRCPSHQAERRAGKGTPTIRHSPPQAGGREGPRVGVVRLSGPRRSSSGRLRGTRLSLRFAQRCRPEVGVPLPAAPSGLLGFPAGPHFHSNWAAWVSPQAANTGNVAPPSGYHRGTWSAQTLGTVRLPPASPGAAGRNPHIAGGARDLPPRSGHPSWPGWGTPAFPRQGNQTVCRR